MPDFDRTDFFTDGSVVDDPYPYFEHLRAQCPVHREPPPRRRGRHRLRRGRARSTATTRPSPPATR
ncbi:hypothetical protein ACRAWF_18330 [Streptomyces sp. L7]